MPATPVAIRTLVQQAAVGSALGAVSAIVWRAVINYPTERSINNYYNKTAASK
jgi:hypothetical protein